MKTKRKNKIILFTLLAMACIVTPIIVQGKSTKLYFDATEVQQVWIPIEFWIEDGVQHIRFHKEAAITGTIDGTEFTGYNYLEFHAKIDLATGDMVVHGSAVFDITWGELNGLFTGIVNAKRAAGDVMTGKFTLQGSGDFDNWKMFGLILNLDPITNNLYGTVLIPN